MDITPLDEALTRTQTALARLEAAVEKRLRQEARRADAEQEFHLMQDDRARLAVELDGALADSRALSTANAAASKALARAAAAIETVLIRAEAQGE
jgi:Domain of unknown function (DUF4164)